MKSYQKLLLALAVASLFVALPAFSQNITSGDVGGTVKDSSGAVVPGATVTIKSPTTGDTRTEVTNNSGAYHFSFLKPAEYTISATSAGLKTDISKVLVLVGEAITLDLLAKVQATQEVIEVSSEAALVQTENANLSATYNTKQLNELPMPGGDITTIAFTAPGVVMSTGSGYGNFSSHGLPGTANLYTINGNDYNDAYLNLNNSGASNLLLGGNEVQEAAVISNAYSVQYGRQAGAQINYTTKSGTNSFHGDLLYNYNGDRLNANDFFANESGTPKSKAISNQWGGDVGGPIRKDKDFFFFDTEGLYYTLPSFSVVSIPSPQFQQYVLGNITPAQVPLYQNAFNLWNGTKGASNAVPITTGGGNLQDASGNLGCGFAGFAGTPAPGGGTFGVNVPCGDALGATGSNTNKEHLITVREDHSINDKQKIFFRFKADRGLQPTTTNLINPIFNNVSNQPQDEGQVNYTYVISPTVVNNFIGSALYYSAIFGPANPSASLAAFPTSFFLGDGGANGGGFSGYPNSLGSYWPAFPQGRNVGQGQLIDDLSVIKGAHTLKIGVNYRRNRVSDNGLKQNVVGTYGFGSLVDFANGVTSPESAYSQTFTTIDVAHIRLYNIGVYAQDEWAIKSNMKLTFGLRLDRTGNPSCTDYCFSRLNAPFTSSNFVTGANIPYNSSIDTGLNNAYYSVDSVVPQPRLGFVWSPRGSGKTVIRAGFGIFADLAPAALVANLFHNAPFPFTSEVFGGQSVDLASDPNSAAAAAQSQFTAFKTGYFAGQTSAQLGTQFPYYSIPQKFGTPKFNEWSFEIEQPIGAKNVFVVTYSGNHGYDLITQSDFPNAYNANPAQFPVFAGLPAAPADGRFLTVTQLATNGISNYQGLTVQLRRAFSYGFQGQINYTWSHALDDISNGGAGEPFNYSLSLTTLPFPNLRQNYGNADYDIRQNMTADFVWDTPWKFSNKAMNYVLSNWTLSSKFFVRSGTPETLIDSLLAGQVAGPYLTAFGNAELTPTAITGIPHYCGNASLSTPCITAANFQAQGAETGLGNIGRNTLYGPGYFDIDTTLYKNVPITERIKFVIGASAYNLLNHPHFADPVGNIANPGLGLITSTVVAPTSAYGSFQGSVVSGRVLVLTGKFQF